MKRLGSVVCTLLSAALVVPPASASVTYHFEQSAAALDTRFGLFLGGTGPVTFDFTVASVLAPNTIYNFGFSPISTGDSGSVLSFLVNGGNSYSSFASSDFPAHYTYYGSGRSTGAAIHVQTDATGAISLYDILITGLSAASPADFLTVQIQHDTANAGVAVVEGLYNVTYGFSSASLQCVAGCGGSFGVLNAAAVPEPAGWAMMVGGLGMVGFAMRSRRRNSAALA